MTTEYKDFKTLAHENLVPIGIRVEQFQNSRVDTKYGELLSRIDRIPGRLEPLPEGVAETPVVEIYTVDAFGLEMRNAKSLRRAIDSCKDRTGPLTTGIACFNSIMVPEDLHTSILEECVIHLTEIKQKEVNEAYLAEAMLQTQKNITSNFNVRSNKRPKADADQKRSNARAFNDRRIARVM